MKNKILLLTTYNGKFATKLFKQGTKTIAGTMDVNRLSELFASYGYETEIIPFAEIDLTHDYDNCYVLYASSEDEGQFYKQYIEDALLSLEVRHATLIPSFLWFRAHSNKVFQEQIRNTFKDEMLKVPQSIQVGHLSEIAKIAGKVSYPAIIKVSAGSGSRGVVCVRSEEELNRQAGRLMRHTYYDFGYTKWLRFGLFVKRVMRRVTGRRVGDETILRKLPTNSVIIQPLIEGMTGDYKVLVFYDRYFVLFRKNRKNDFRASGSGIFEFPENEKAIEGVLDMAYRTHFEIDAPMLSLDIGMTADHICYLLEYQCVYFGPYTLQFAPKCFVRQSSGWSTMEGPFDLEEEYANAVISYIKERNTNRR